MDSKGKTMLFRVPCAVRAGDVRNIGVSNFQAWHLKELVERRKKAKENAAHCLVPVLNQIELHPGRYQAELETIDYCREHDILIEAYSPLMQGEKQLLENATVVGIAKKRDNVTPAQVCLQWCIQHGFVVLPKSETVERITGENSPVALAKAFGGAEGSRNAPLTAAEMKTLDELGKDEEFEKVCWSSDDVD